MTALGEGMVLQSDTHDGEYGGLCAGPKEGGMHKVVSENVDSVCWPLDYVFRQARSFQVTTTTNQSLLRRAPWVEHCTIFPGCGLRHSKFP